MADWDRRSNDELAAVRQRALRRQVVDLVAPFSPFWRERLTALGLLPEQVASPAGLVTLPPVGERDVCPDGDPSGAAALVLQAGERGWALAAEGPRLRQGLARRFGLLDRRGTRYATVVENDTRPTSYVWAGLALRFPLASTRSDLDLVARAGARLWQVLGLDRGDVLVTGLPPGPTAANRSLALAALGAGAPALHVGAAADELVAALRLVPASVVALPVAQAAGLLAEIAGAPLDALRTVLLVGAPSDDERRRVRDALGRADVAVLAVHVPDGHRLAWGECRESGGQTGLHGYPDLEVLHVVDPATGKPAGTGELVLTQLELRGSAQLRWRTADLVEGIDSAVCPACRRNVPRVLGLRRAALVPRLALRDGPVSVDLRAVCAALAGRGELRDWRVLVGTSRRDGAPELLVHVRPARDVDGAAAAVGAAREVRRSAGVLPTQVVVADGPLPESPRLVLRT